MIDLARKSVLHGWRRYLPVAIAVGVSGLMMIVQVALVMGAISLSAAPIRQSDAQLWVGPAAAESLDQSQGLSSLAVGRLWLDPAVTKIEALGNPGYASIGEDEEGGAYANVVAVDPARDSMIFAKIIPEAIRAQLGEPGTVALDRVDARNLKLVRGDTIKVNRQPLRVIGLLDGARGMSGVQLYVSQLTAREMGQSGGGEMPRFYAVRLAPGADPQGVIRRLTEVSPAPEYRVWLPNDLANATVRAWALLSGAGTLFLASSAIALVITLMVVSQTLGAAVAASIREYAALRAYGIGFRSVQWVVMKQGFYVCAAALLLTGAASAIVLAALRLRGVPAQLPPPLALAVVTALAVTVALSNLMAVRRLRRADPASLLR